MAEYTIISDVSKELVKRLRDGLCPDIINSKDAIGFSNDTESNKYILTLYLYNIVKSDPTVINNSRGNFIALRLEYMLMAESDAEPDIKPLQEQLILGKAISVFNDKPFIYGLNDDNLPIGIEMNNPSLYDKLSLNSKKPALFYYAAPVLIDTKQAVEAARVIRVGDTK